MIIDGKKLALDKLTKLKIRVARLKAKNITPKLAIILMGSNEASNIYVRQKGIKAKEIGAQTQLFHFKKNVTNKKIEALVKKLDKNPKIHGIILQRPAPIDIEVDRLNALVSPIKEIDGFGPKPKYRVPVAQAVILMLKFVYEKTKQKEDFKKWLKSKKIAVIGKGQTAGRPIIELLEKYGAVPNIIDSKTENGPQILKSADIIVSAVGKRVLSSKEINKDVVLIGVGLYTNEVGKLKGDYDDEDVENVASFYSPTPGGVGPLNVACLMENLVNAATLKN